MSALQETELRQYESGEEVRVKTVLLGGPPYCIHDDEIGYRRPGELGIISHIAEPVDDLLPGQQLLVVMYGDGSWGMFGNGEVQPSDQPLEAFDGIWPDA